MPARFPRGCLVALGAALALALVALLAVRAALQPERLGHWAEAQLTSALGQPVTIGRMRARLLPTPRVEGSDIAISRARPGAPSLALHGIVIVPRVASVLSRPVIIDRVEVRGLVLNIRRDKDGRWFLPFSAAASPANTAPATGPSAPAAGPPLPAGPPASIDVREVRLDEGRIAITDDVLRTPRGSPEVASIDRIAATVRREASVTSLEGLTGELGASTISGTGRLSGTGLHLQLTWNRLRDADLPEILALLGTTAPAGLSVDGDTPMTLTLDVDNGGAATASGTVAARSVSWGTLRATSVQAPLRFARNVLTIDPLTLSAYGGTGRGRVGLDLGATPARWTLASQLEGIDINAFLSANTPAHDKVSGVGRLNATLRGAAAQPVLHSLGGTVRAVISHGVIRNFRLLAAINAALRITEGSGNDTAFETLSATFDIAGGRATTNDLRLVAGELSVDAAGTITFEQHLELTGQATFTRAKSQELIARVNELSGLKNGQGEIEVPLRISGTASNPSFQVDVAAALGRVLQKEMKRQIERGLRRFFERPH